MYLKKPSLLKPFEKIFAILALIYFTKAIFYPFIAGYGQVIAAGGNALLWVINGSIYIISGLLIIFGPYYDRLKLIQLLSRQKILLLFFGLVVLSIFWSSSPDFTIRRCVALIGSTLFALYFSVRFSPAEKLKLLSTTLSILAVISLAYVLFYPSIAVSKIMGRTSWRGCFGHNTILGSMMAISLILSAAWPKQLKRTQGMSLWMTMLYGVLLFKSNAVGTFASLFILLVITPWIFLKWHDSKLVVAEATFLSITSLLGSYIIFMYADGILTVFGRDSTFTGRLPFWQAALSNFSGMKFLFGYGFEAFDQSLENHIIRTISRFHASGMHNGYLEVLFGTGIIGLIIILTVFVMVGYRLWRSYFSNSYSRFATLLFVFILAENLSGARMARSNDIYWILSIMVFCYAAGKVKSETISLKGLHFE